MPVRSLQGARETRWAASHGSGPVDSIHCAAQTEHLSGGRHGIVGVRHPGGSQNQMGGNSDDIGEKKRQAIALFRRNQLNETKALCLDICRVDPSDARMWHLLGLINGRLGITGAAAEAFRNAVTADPRYAPAHFDLGNAFLAQGRAEEALACYREALRLDGRSAPLLNNLGTVLNALNRLEEAEQSYREALQLNPNAMTYCNLGNVLVRRQRPDEAAEMYRQCLKHGEGDSGGQQSPQMNVLMRSARVFLSGGEYVFVLSHMRSFSSLLSHILGSNGEISGYSEMHRPYRDPLDLLQLRVKIYESMPDHLPKRYVLDKILHNKYRVADSVLLQDSLKLVFLVRRPLDTIKSIMYMGSRLFDIAWCRDPEKATQYYIGRLLALKDIAERTESSGLFIRSEDVTARTQEVLFSLTDFLGLRRPLSQEYMIFENTGKPVFGDPSTSIMSGTVLRRDGAKYRDLVVPDGYLSKACAAYDLCCEALTRNCKGDGAI